MVTTELIDYIKSQINKNISKEIITSKLIQVGWGVGDIRDGFSKIENELAPVMTNSDFVPEKVEFPENTTDKQEESGAVVKKIFDPYRELPDGIDVEQSANYKTIEKKETPVVSALETMNPIKVVEIAPQEKPTAEEVKPKEETKPVIEEFSAEIPFVSVLDKMEPIKVSKLDPNDIKKPTEDKPYDDIKIITDQIEEDVSPKEDEENVSAAKPFVSVLEKMEPIKIWVPSAVKPVKETIKEIPIIPISTDIEPYRVEVGPSDVPKQDNATTPSVAVDNKPATETEIKKDNPAFELIPTINKTKVEDSPKSEIFIVPEIVTTKEVIKEVPTEEAKVEKSNISHTLESQSPNPVFNSALKNTTDIVKKSAIISSYTQDILSAQKEKDDVKPKGKRNLLLKWGIAIFVLSLVGGVIFAFVEGSFRIPGLMKLSVVKDDPRTVLVDTPSNLSNLKSYKVDTTVTISSPALSNITTGLSSGDVVVSRDKDTVSINSKGFVNHTSGKTIASYLLDFKSSLLDKDIKSDLKYDGSNIIASVPDLSFILKDDAPREATVSFKPEEIGSVISEFSNETQESIKKFDIYNILSGKIPEYVKTETALTFKEFVSKLEYMDKGEELIHGNVAYHYEFTAGSQVTKKLLSSLADLFILNLSDQQKKNLSEVIGSSKISSFEVWVGKDDDNLYQIKFTLTAPLSRVLRLNDSGIAGNEVTLDWVTTYYDFDVQNEITMPEQKISMDDFVNDIKNVKIKNIISSFKPNASMFKNSTGSYGQRLNPSGSCANPNPGTLFSPQGHSKGATNSIGLISSSMNSLLSATNGSGYCFSNANSWALSAPLYSSPDSTPSFYCADSKGNVNTLNNPIKGPVCE